MGTTCGRSRASWSPPATAAPAWRRRCSAAAVGHAFAHGAEVVEGYPVDPAQRPKAGPADLYHGTVGLFLAAGFEVASEAVPGRAVVRLAAPGPGATPPAG